MVSEREPSISRFTGAVQERAESFLPKERPRPKTLLIIRATLENQEIGQLPRLRGSEVRFDAEGKIFYPTWRVKKFLKKPEFYTDLGGKPVVYTPERKQKIVEKVWHHVGKEGGGVEVAIRSIDHVLFRYAVVKGRRETRKGIEVEQTEKTMRRIRELFDFFCSYTKEIPDEDFLDAQEKTAELLVSLGMDKPALQLKQQIRDQMMKASGGVDRLGRRNPMAMVSILESAYRKILGRQEEVGFIRVKYWEARRALADERRESREVLTRVAGEFRPGRPLVSWVRKGTEPRKTQIGIVNGILRVRENEVCRIRLKPYKSLALEVAEEIKTLRQRLLKEGIKSLTLGDLITLRQKIREVLEQYRRIYPENPEEAKNGRSACE